MIVPRFSPSLDWRDFFAFAKGFGDGGEAVREFENAFAKRIGRKHAVAVPSARAGLYFLLKTCGRRPSPILVPALTYYAIPAIAELAGFTPRFVDIDPGTLLLNENLLPACEAGAIIPTHLYGRAQDMDKILTLASEKNWLVIEDAAQGLGAKWRGRSCGSFADAAYFTFGPTKNFSTLGGGMIAVDDDDWAKRIREMMKPVALPSKSDALAAAGYGFAMSLAASRLAFSFALYPPLRVLKPSGIDFIESATADPPRNYPLPPRSLYEGGIRGSQARVGLNQLRKLDMLTSRRRVNAARLLELLKDIEGIRIPQMRDGEQPAFMSFPILVEDPDALSKELIARGIDTTRGYMSDCSALPSFKQYASPCPEAAHAAAHMLHLPVHAQVTPEALGHIARSLRSLV